MDPVITSSQDLLELPIEVLERIFGRLDGYSVHHVLLTCRTLRAVADSVAVWSQVSDSFWDNLDGSQVTVSRLRSPKSSDGTSSLRGSLSDSGKSDSGGVGYAGPLRRSHGKRKLIRDGSEVLHQVVYQHRFHAHGLQVSSDLSEWHVVGMTTEQQQQAAGSVASAGKTASPVSLTLSSASQAPAAPSSAVAGRISAADQGTMIMVEQAAALIAASGPGTTTRGAQSEIALTSSSPSLQASQGSQPPHGPQLPLGHATQVLLSSQGHGLQSSQAFQAPQASPHSPGASTSSEASSSSLPSPSNSLLIPLTPSSHSQDRSPFSSSVGSSDTHSTASSSATATASSAAATQARAGLATSPSFSPSGSLLSSIASSAGFGTPPSSLVASSSSASSPVASFGAGFYGGVSSFGTASSSSSSSNPHSYNPLHLGLHSISSSSSITDQSNAIQRSSPSSTSSSISSVASTSSSSSSKATSSTNSDPNYLADSIATLSLSRVGANGLRRIGGFSPIPQAQSWHGQRPPSEPQQERGADGPSQPMHAKSTPLRHTTSSPVPRPPIPSSGASGTLSSNGSGTYSNSFGFGSRSSGSGSSSAGSTGEIVDLPPFRELDISDAPDEDVLRRWLPTEEEITYILKENHHVSVEDFKVYYRLISTCLIVDPSLAAPPISSDPMTIVTPMSSESVEQKLLRANQELWTFGSPHRPLRRRRIFASLPEAIRHAKEGDFIYLHKGVYTESLTITKPIRLCGQMRIQDSIFLQAQMMRTIHWRAPPLSRPRGPLPLPLSSHDHHHTSASSPSSAQPSSPSSPRTSPHAAFIEPYLRGSISCLDFPAELLNGEPSLVVHPRAALDVHHSLFRNRRGTGVRIAQHASVQLLRTSFVGNMLPMDISPQCTSLGLYKNIYKDPLSAELLTLVKDIAIRNARLILNPQGSSISPRSPTSSINTTVAQLSNLPSGTPRCCSIEPPLTGPFASIPSTVQASPSSGTSNSPFSIPELASLKSSSLPRLQLPPCVRPEAQFFPEAILCFVDMLHLKDFKDKALSMLVPELIGSTLAVLTQFGACNLPLAQNLLTALHVFSKVEPARSCINANDGLKVVCEILKTHEMDVFIQLEGISTIWHLSSHDALRGVVESLPVEEVIMTALGNFASRSSLVLVALGALWNLSWLSDRCSAKIVPHFNKLFCIQRQFLTNEQIQCNICGLLWNVSTHPTLAPSLAKLNPIESILPALKHHSTSAKLFKPACSLLNFLFSTRSDQRRQFVESGGVAILIDAMATFATTNLDLFISIDSLFSVLWEGQPCPNEFDQHNGLFALLKSSYAYFGAHRSITRLKPIPATVAVILPQQHQQPPQPLQTAQQAGQQVPTIMAPQPHIIQRVQVPRVVPHSARPKPLADLKIFSFCMQRKQDIYRLLSVMNLVCNIKTTQLHKLVVSVDLVATDSTTFEELHSVLKNAEEGHLHLFIATLLKLVLSKDPSRLFAVRGGALDLLAFLTNSLLSAHGLPSSTTVSHNGSPSISSSFLLALSSAPSPISSPAPSFSGGVEGAADSSSQSPVSSGASPASSKRNRLRTAVRGNMGSFGGADSSGAGMAGDSSRIPLTQTESMSIEIAKMIFDCYAMLASMFDLDSRAGRLNQSVYQEYFTSLEKFERALLLLPRIPQQLISWIKDRNSSLLTPLELQTQQTNLGPADVSNNPAARRFTNLKLSNSWLVVSPPVSLMQDPGKPLYLDTRFKTRSMLVKSDYATIWNPHGSLESIRANHFASSGTVYFELELLRFEAQDREGQGVSAPFAVGWCTARSVFYSAKVGVANEPHCLASDPRRRRPYHRPIVTSPTPIVASPSSSAPNVTPTKQAIPPPRMSLAPHSAPQFPSSGPFSSHSSAPFTPPISPPTSPTAPFASLAQGNPITGSSPSVSSSVATTTADILSMTPWSVGDRVQCFINIDRMQIWYGLNGIWLDEPSFVDFRNNFDPTLDIGYAPAVSLYQECEAKFHHQTECIYSPPPQDRWPYRP